MPFRGPTVVEPDKQFADKATSGGENRARVAVKVRMRRACRGQEGTTSSWPRVDIGSEIHLRLRFPNWGTETVQHCCCGAGWQRGPQAPHILLLLLANGVGRLRS